MKMVPISKLKVRDFRFPHEWVDVSQAGDPPFSAELVESIKKLGILSPILVTEDLRVHDGRAQAVAAFKADLKEIPATVLTSEDQVQLELHKRNAARRKR